ncbi:MAG: adenosylhomocysteinase [Armatimonadetes bacterium]|nr:adenosylhomocysteinase [Armatimonadota bacterium]NIM23845.1 adenosylhomocysteinase [Armatimonadota bacterium]NIM67724.1 adenosylhomocysteinase [Armatimonadota bacterium]NIM76233.1 adenosylhomocysteinase [Armatimonadota bacterium]NIN05926.1 adenosylhomocysteinase [Armatimonadota bacterium]
MKSDIKDAGLAKQGSQRVEFAYQEMPVLRLLEERFSTDKPLKNLRLGACLHVTSETANLMRILKAGGAELALCASNPLSTQDDVAAWLVKELKVPTFAIKGEDSNTYYQHLNSVLDIKPNLTMDDGADLVSEIHSRRRNLIGDIIGGSEETTTGVIRLRSLERQGVLAYPIIAVNDADTKHLFDNRYGTGQSTIDGLLRATNLLLAGRKVVVCGYGMCGRGVAMRARGMGARVIICEVEPLCALEAVMEGYEVLPLMEAAKIGDVFITVTGDKHVLRSEHFQVMKNGAMLANSGHFDVEIDLPALAEMAKERKVARPFCEEFQMADGRSIFVLAEGRLLNLAAAEGHPANVMDMSFANQALCAAWVASHGQTLERKVYPVPKDIDREIASLKLHSMGITIDSLTPEQEKYLSSWEAGT